jgi:hypothetical protein
MKLLHLSVFPMLVLGIGCVSSSPTTGDESTVTSEVQGCNVYMCGSNSPQIAELGFWELNFPTVLGIAGLPNNVGLQIDDFERAGHHYLPRVFGGRLTARSGGVTLAGEHLVGGWLNLHNGARRFRMRVTSVDTTDSWATPPDGSPLPQLESYQLDWSELANNQWSAFRSIHSAATASGTSNPYELYTLLFEGDRIDAARKLDTGVDPTWVNFGVAGSALAKLALTGHTQAAHDAHTFETTLAERQTMLKMLVADYCGDGTPFTIAGQPLDWADDHGTMTLAALATQPPQPLVLEARWNEHGAACLNVPRLDAHWTTLGQDTFGSDIYDQVKAHCGAAMPPPCLDSDLGTDGYHLVTASVPLAAPAQ